MPSVTVSPALARNRLREHAPSADLNTSASRIGRGNNGNVSRENAIGQSQQSLSEIIRDLRGELNKVRGVYDDTTEARSMKRQLKRDTRQKSREALVE